MDWMMHELHDWLNDGLNDGLNDRLNDGWITSGIAGLNRSKYLLERCSDCSFGSFVIGFKNAKIGADLGNRATTSGDITKRWIPADSVYQIGLYIPPKRRTNCSWRWLVSGFKKGRKTRKSEAFSIIPQQCVVTWQIGDQNSIQRVK